MQLAKDSLVFPDKEIDFVQFLKRFDPEKPVDFITKFEKINYFVKYSNKMVKLLYL